MKLVVSQVQGQGFVEVTAQHGDQKLVWSTKAFSKVKLDNPSRIFEEINAFWEWAGPETEQAVWECYVKVKENLDMVADNWHIGNNIRFYLNQMYSHMPMERFRHWLLTVGNLHIPADIQEEITEESRYSDADQTYLKSDYINLATVGLAVRPMVPIWGEYIDAVSENDQHKELEALGLVYDTEILDWPRESTVVDKLLNYINRRIDDQSVSMASLWKGLGTAEIPSLMLAKAIVRRLTIMPLRDSNAPSIIANIFWYVRSNLKPVDRTTADRVNDKRVEGSGGGDEEDKTSFIEAHKIKHKITLGDAAAFEAYAKNMAGAAQKVDPTVNLELVKLCMQQIMVVENKPISQHQIRLAQWVMAKAFPARAYAHIPKATINQLLASAQALMWHWGFLDLAVLMQVERYFQPDSAPFLTAHTRTGSRIPPKYKEELNILFPHMKPLRVKPDTDAEGRSDNYAAIAINNVTADIRQSAWTYHGPAELHRLAGQPSGQSLVIVGNDLKARITELVIHLVRVNQ